MLMVVFIKAQQHLIVISVVEMKINLKKENNLSLADVSFLIDGGHN